MSEPTKPDTRHVSDPVLSLQDAVIQEAQKPPHQVIAAIVRRCISAHCGFAHGSWPLFCPSCAEEVEAYIGAQNQAEKQPIPATLTRLVAEQAQVTQEQDGLTFDVFAKANRQRCEAPDGFNHKLNSWSTSDWFTAILGELGEAANIAKKLNRYRDGVRGNKETAAALNEKLRKELGDTFVYLDLLCQSLGVSVADAAVEVFNAKSVEIGYPVVLSVERAEAAESSLAQITQERDALSIELYHARKDTTAARGDRDRFQQQRNALQVERDALVQALKETETALRRELWLGHGHDGLYGDDGEMQCGLCRPVFDYKRAPLADVQRAAHEARLQRAAAALASVEGQR